MAECESEYKLTTDTPYLTLGGELWGVYCDSFGENDSTLYKANYAANHFDRFGEKISIGVHIFSPLTNVSQGL